MNVFLFLKFTFSDCQLQNPCGPGPAGDSGDEGLPGVPGVPGKDGIPGESAQDFENQPLKGCFVSF